MLLVILEVIVSIKASSGLFTVGTCLPAFFRIVDSIVLYFFIHLSSILLKEKKGKILVYTFISYRIRQSVLIFKIKIYFYI